MRIIGGAWRGRSLKGPADSTRPTADRVRQALFDTLIHAAWGGRDVVEGAEVLDAFAGTGALGLEALSRGAVRCSFIEKDRTALAVLRANIAACHAEPSTIVLPTDALAVGPGPAARLVFLDPPYHHDLVPRVMDHLHAVGRLAAGAIIVAETSRDEAPWSGPMLDERCHGKARLSIWRME